MPITNRIISFLVRLIVPECYRDKFILVLLQAFNRDPLQFAHSQLGILKYQDMDISGENYVMNTILPKILANDIDGWVIFDVGANEGDFTKNFHNRYNSANIYSFEPNGNSFAKLNVNLASSNVKLYNFGFGKKKCNLPLFTYLTDSSSTHASLYQDVFTEIHKSNSIESINVAINRLDEFCLDEHIEKIDFLKIDTEGNEYDVLLGGGKLIETEAIKIIQFEFNEMNVISRVFLKDFFDLLGKKYNIYRLDTKSLIPIKQYNPVNEIFKFQNFLAIQKDIDCLDASTI